MGIRKHLKAALGFLAVGSVAFAGAANAAGNNELYVEQHAKDSATVEAPASYKDMSNVDTEHGRAVQYNTSDSNPNKAYIKQGEDSAKTKEATLKFVQIGEGNQVGDANDKPLLMKAQDHKAELTIIQAKDQNHDSSDAVTGNKIVSDSLNSGTQLTIEATSGDNTVTIKQKTDNNEIDVGYIKGGSVNLDVTQEGGNTNKIKFTDLEASSTLDLTIEQNGGTNKLYFGSYDGQTDASASQKVNVGSLTGGITQSGDSNVAQFYNVDASAASVSLNNYDKSGNLSQDGNDYLNVNNLKVDGASAELDITQGADTNTITIGDIASGSPTDQVHIGQSLTFKANQSNYADITLLSVDISGEANFDIQQSGGSASKHNTVKLQNVTVNGDVSKFNVTQENGGGNNVLLGGAGNSLKLGSLSAEITQDGQDNDVEILDGSVDGAVTAKISQTGTDNVFKIGEVDIKGDLTIKGYSSDTLEMTGDDNTVNFKNLSSGGDTTIAMTIVKNNDGGNEFIAKNVSAGTTNTIKLNISGDDNKIKGATGSSVHTLTMDDAGLVMEAGSGSNDFDMNITGDDNKIGIYQVASASNELKAVIQGRKQQRGLRLSKQRQRKQPRRHQDYI